MNSSKGIRLWDWKYKRKERCLAGLNTGSRIMNELKETFELRNGVGIPKVGFGTYKATDEEAAKCVKAAVAYGYRHIDTAYFYGNEQGVGRGIRECIAKQGLKREDIFVTSKVWNTDRGYEKTLAAFEKTMENLGLDTLDLYLIHWPAAAHQHENWEQLNLGTWRAMSELYRAGRIRAIGVSNFLPHHLKALMETEVKPMVNQIEYHPGCLQEETVNYCRENGIIVEAWSPLGRGRVLEHPALMELAEKYGKSVAQLCLRFCLQNKVVPLPKSVSEERIKENGALFDFEISREDMEAIHNLGEFGGSGLNPDKVDF